MQRVPDAAIPRRSVVCRTPIFTGAAILAKHTDAIATLPLSVATVLATISTCKIIRPPIKLPTIDIFQYWHSRFQNDPAQSMDQIGVSADSTLIITHRRTAIDCDRGALNVTRLLRTEKQCKRGNVSRLPEPAQAVFGRGLLLELFDRFAARLRSLF